MTEEIIEYSEISVEDVLKTKNLEDFLVKAAEYDWRNHLISLNPQLGKDLKKIHLKQWKNGNVRYYIIKSI